MLIISADSHASEPDELFQRLPEEYQRRAPRLEERNGGLYYIQEGQRPVRQDIATAQLTEEDKRREFRAEDGTGYGREAGTDIPLRLADLKEDGVTGEIIYPNGIFNAWLLRTQDTKLPSLDCITIGITRYSMDPMTNLCRRRLSPWRTLRRLQRKSKGWQGWDSGRCHCR